MFYAYIKWLILQERKKIDGENLQFFFYMNSFT